MKPTSASSAKTHVAMVLLALAVFLALRLPAGETLGPGIRYRAITEPKGPLAIHVLEIERGPPGVSLAASVGAGVKGKETVPDMVAAVPRERGTVLAAINGDYFEMNGEPRFFGTLGGLTIVDGELISGPSGPAFCVDRTGSPLITQAKARFEITWPDGSKRPFGINCSTSDFKSEVGAADVVLFTPRFARETGIASGRELVLAPATDSLTLPLRTGQVYTLAVSELRTAGNTPIAPDTLVLSLAAKSAKTVPTLRPGDTVRVSTAVDKDLPAVATAVGGGPLLLAAGDIVCAPEKTPGPRAPRTAVGYSATHIFLVVVDGRQPRRSIGMSHRELAEFMLRLGCTEALNLDGGGSTTMWVSGKVVNSPSDGVLRPVGNCLLVIRQTQP